MEPEYESLFTEEELAQRRARREARRKKREQEARRRMLMTLGPIVLLILAAVLLILLRSCRSKKPEAPAKTQITETQVPLAAAPEVPKEEPKATIYSAETTAETVQLCEDIRSSYAVFIDLQSNTILAEKDAFKQISPASMTKLLTLLVACENIEDLDDTFTMTIDLTDYCFRNDCSVMGLTVGETVPIRELLYGCILPSGADASLGLATYVAGSQEAFVKLMNEKLKELGLTDTAHFTNCVGLYDEKHYCTVYDMAMILKAALDNELCSTVLAAHTYQTEPNTEHPEGLLLSNWFLRRIEDKETGSADIIAAKTGYVVQSGSCAASCGQDAAGNRYLCVTGDAPGSWPCIYDHADLYLRFTGSQN